MPVAQALASQAKPARAARKPAEANWWDAKPAYSRDVRPSVWEWAEFGPFSTAYPSLFHPPSVSIPMLFSFRRFIGRTTD